MSCRASWRTLAGHRTLEPRLHEPFDADHLGIKAIRPDGSTRGPVWPSQAAATSRAKASGSCTIPEITPNRVFSQGPDASLQDARLPARAREGRGADSETSQESPKEKTSMSIRSPFLLVCSVLFIVFVLGTSARVSFGDHAPAVHVLPGVSSELPADPMAPVDECVIPLEEPAESLGDFDQEIDLGYECPIGVPYCRRDSDCSGFCGPGGFDVCFRGCCTCAG